MISTPPLNRGEPSRIILTGRHSYGLDNITIKSWGEGAHLFVGGFCSIAGDQKVFVGGNHRTDWATTFPFGHLLQETFPAGAVNGSAHPVSKGHVVIEHDVWIGNGCTIMSGLTIGSGSVIAAKSVVVKDVPPYTIVGGNPARTLKKRFSDSIIEQLLEIQWWNYDDATINKIVTRLQQPLKQSIIDEIKTLLSN